MRNQTYWINQHGEACDWRAPDLPAPLLRKTFTIDILPETAMIRFAAPGWADISINGKLITEDIMIPAVTQLDKHTGFCEYDVTALLRPGKNVIGAVLGNGWFNCATHELWHFDKAPWRNFNRLFLELYADGKKSVKSDSSWRCNAGPTIFNHLRSGEHFDARNVIPGWDTPDFDDSSWKKVCMVTPPPGTLIKDDSPQCRINEVISPVKSWMPDGDSVIFDFGKNMTGFVEITTAGKAGVKIAITYSELLASNNDLCRDNVACYIVDGDKAQTDIFIHDGSDNFVWHPRFVYHGFRYVKVLAYGDARVTNIKACYVHTGFAPAGTAEISNKIAQKVFDCTRNSYIANFTGIPTDCPHREKNGWTGDAQLACETGLWLYDGAKNYDHFLQILADGQRPTGQLSGIAPNAGWGYNWGSGPVWDIALFEMPYRIWKFTGNLDTAKKYYPNMQKYLDYILPLRNDDGVFNFGLGDWCHHTRSRIVTVALTSTAFVYGMLDIMEEFAVAFAPADVEKYREIKTEVKTDFIRNFRNADGSYAKDEWTANACALYFKLDDSPALAEHLAQQVRNNDHKADFGIVGAKLIPRILAEYGYAADAFKLYTQTEFPGWGNWIARGATSLWETWHGNGSQTHIMFGDFAAWCFRYLAGITIIAPGFKKVLLSPADIPEAGDFAFEYNTPHGKIIIEKCGNIFRYSIPENIDLTLNIPENWSSGRF